MTDIAKVRAKAREIHVKDEAKLDDWLVVNEVFEEVAEPLLNPEPGRPSSSTTRARFPRSPGPRAATRRSATGGISSSPAWRSARPTAS
jgi:hypothetical protein